MEGKKKNEFRKCLYLLMRNEHWIKQKRKNKKDASIINTVLCFYGST